MVCQHGKSQCVGERLKFVSLSRKAVTLNENSDVFCVTAAARTRRVQLA